MKLRFIVVMSFLVTITAHAELFYRGLLSYSDSVPFIDRYPEEVAFFSSMGQARLPGYDLILHLHGFRQNRDSLQGRLENFDDVLREFDFDTLLKNTGRRAVLVVPSSLGKCDTFASHLIPGDRFSSFMQATFQKIGAYPNRIILIGHSGSYHALAAIAQSSLQDFISELYLLDASYGEEQLFARFSALPLHRLVSVYRRDTSTALHSFQLWKILHPGPESSASLDQFYQLSYPAEVQASALPIEGAAFVVTSGDHWQVVNDFWTKLVAITASAPVPASPDSSPSATRPLLSPLGDQKQNTSR